MFVKVRLGNSTWNNKPPLCPKELVLQNEIPKFCKTRTTRVYWEKEWLDDAIMPIITVEGEAFQRRGVIKRVIDRHRRKQQQQQHNNNDQRLGNHDTIRHDKHPLHYLLEGASIFSHWKARKRHQHEQKRRETNVNENGWKKWKYAMSDDFQLTLYQIGLVKELAKRVVLKAKNNTITSSEGNSVDYDCVNNISCDDSKTVVSQDFAQRVNNVPWGGVTN